jgi:hypothetical protein
LLTVTVVFSVAEAPSLPVQETVYSVVDEGVSGAEPTWLPDPIRLPLPVRVQEFTPVQFQFKVTLSGGTIEPDGLALRVQDGVTGLPQEEPFGEHSSAPDPDTTAQLLLTQARWLIGGSQASPTVLH